MRLIPQKLLLNYPMSSVAIIVETFLRFLIWLLISGKRGQEVLMLRKEFQV